MNELKIKYLGHSSWIVETKNHLLVFDYGKIKRKRTSRFNFENLQNKKIVLFFSHVHEDHYDEDFHKKSQAYKGVEAFLGDFGSNLPNSITIKPHEHKIFDKMEIYTAASSDLGVCFLVVADEVCIFFGGDNAAWGSENANKIYYEEINYIKELSLKIDIAFIPVCNFDKERPEDITKGAIFAVETLNPTLTFPMHAAGKEAVYQDFNKDFLSNGNNQKIICMKEPGQIFEI